MTSTAPSGELQPPDVVALAMKQPAGRRAEAGFCQLHTKLGRYRQAMFHAPVALTSKAYEPPRSFTALEPSN